MQLNGPPDQRYTMRWSGGRGEVKFLRRSDGSRLRYFTTGTGPPLVLLHTVRTQLDYFQRVVPALWDQFTVYTLDLPGMGWSDIVPRARYDEPELRSAVVEFIRTLDLHEVTLAGESMGAALALLASIDLTDNVSKVIAFNPYDYQSGFERGNWFARLIGSPPGCPVPDRSSPGWRAALPYEACCGAASPITARCRKTFSASCAEAAADAATRRFPEPSCVASTGSSTHEAVTRG